MTQRFSGLFRRCKIDELAASRPRSQLTPEHLRSASGALHEKHRKSVLSPRRGRKILHSLPFTTGRNAINNAESPSLMVGDRLSNHCREGIASWSFRRTSGQFAAIRGRPKPSMTRPNNASPREPDGVALRPSLAARSEVDSTRKGDSKALLPLSRLQQFFSGLYTAQLTTQIPEGNAFNNVALTSQFGYRQLTIGAGYFSLPQTLHQFILHCPPTPSSKLRSILSTALGLKALSPNSCMTIGTR